MLQKYEITKENLPIMSSDDPVAKALQAKAGDVVKIVRFSEQLNKDELYFRLVVD